MKKIIKGGTLVNENRIFQADAYQTVFLKKPGKMRK